MDVSPALGEREAALAPQGPGAGEQARDRELPAGAELSGQPLGGMVAPPKAPISVGRDEGERSDGRPLDGLGHELRREPREEAEPAFLPGRDKRLHRRVVGDGRPRRGEREAPARALPAAGNGPGSRRAAARAEGPAQARQRAAAPRAHCLAGGAAGHAALGEQKVEYAPRLGQGGA